MKPFRVEMQPWMAAMGWAGIVFFGLCAVGASMSGAWWPAAEFLGFVALSVWLVRALGPIEADYGGIWQQTPSGRHEMQWSEVTKVEVTSSDILSSSDIVLHGAGKRLALPGPTVWRAAGQEEMARFIESQIQAWSIPREVTLAAAMRTSKNTKPRKKPRPPLSS